MAQILEAAGDATALVERFGGAARALAELPTESGDASPTTRRTVRRTLLDVADLARSTLRLFEKVAEQKSIAVALDAPEPVARRRGSGRAASARHALEARALGALCRRAGRCGCSRRLRFELGRPAAQGAACGSGRAVQT
jgi:hypothetical protein